MGIKTSITLSQVPEKYQHCKLIPTTDGVMATTYLLDDRYVLKLFEEDTPTEVLDNEITLLSELKNLPVPKVIDRFKIEQNEVMIYTQIHGNVISDPALTHIAKIATFLKDFHQQSKHIKVSCTKQYQKEELKQLIEKTNHTPFKTHFENIELTFKNDGVIHGDLFPDNCKFKADKLSGVYDFSDLCLGDFHFDLAVIAVGWCFEGTLLNRQKTEVLLEHYGSPMDHMAFIAYIRYALLYYATTRFIAGRDYPILSKRLERLS